MTTSPAAILIDLEGTLCSISFVKDTLFPYATEKVSAFLEKKWDVDEVQEAVEGMRLQSEKDVEAKVEGAILIPNKDATKEEQIKGVSDNLKWLISIDNKGTFMKKLSGLIWEEGYSNGDIKGHAYDDVKPTLEAWKKDGKKLYIYSSGSVQAQQLLLKYSILGDLQPLIDGYYDTKVGHKQESGSYKNILEKIELPADKVVFLTDVVKEAEAAKEVGIKSILLLREGNAPLTNEDVENYQTEKSFADISFDSTSAKRKITDDDEGTPPAKVAKKEETVAVEEKVENNDKVDVEMESTEKTVEKTNETESTTEKTEELTTDKVELMETDSAETVVEEKGKQDESVKEKTEKPVEIEEVTTETEKKVEEAPAEATKETAVETEKEVTEPVADEKIDEILGEKGVELEKECDDILSKVDSIIKSDIKVKAPVGEELVEKTEKETSPVEVEKDTPAVEVPPVEENLNGKTENGVSEVKENGSHKNDDHVELNGKDTNGDSKTDEEVNGSKTEKPEEVEGEIKVKKVVTEEPATETPEQTVET